MLKPWNAFGSDSAIETIKVSFHARNGTKVWDFWIGRRWMVIGKGGAWVAKVEMTDEGRAYDPSDTFDPFA